MGKYYDVTLQGKANKMVEVKGKGGIVVKVLADSINQQGNRLTTFELTYARMVHSELLTHKMLCSNSASSRAIPFAKMAEQLTARPVRFGQANPGMQDKGEDFDALVYSDAIGDHIAPNEAWESAKYSALCYAKRFYDAGYHKQVFNRLTEPFQMMKTVISGTEWVNFFWLRNDNAADPTLHELARCMKLARIGSVPEFLKAGEWHLPYVDSVDIEVYATEDGSVFEKQYYIGECGEDSFQWLTYEEAIKVSCARTAAVSFRNEDYGLEKCLEVYARLIGDERKHSSAMQHAATPMKDKVEWDIHNVNVASGVKTWEEGVSHATRDGQLWSGQYCGWVMHRKTIPGENYSLTQHNK